MIASDKLSCRLLSHQLKVFGIKEIVLCPGSRNTPIINTLANDPFYTCYSIIDEREAAFFALGIAEITGKPVVIVCTSGSALLNFSPAVAEAFYKQVPLIVVSADRPENWIDQLEGQTIVQRNALENVIKKSYNISEPHDIDTENFANRLINDALVNATIQPQAPVHINIPLSEPLNRVRAFEEMPWKSIMIPPVHQAIDKEFLLMLGRKIQSTQKVLIVAGPNPPSSKLTRSLEHILRLPNVAIMDENLSNLHLSESLGYPETLLRCLDETTLKELCPDIVIYFGGAVVSKTLKKWLRDNSKKIELWHISEHEGLIDLFLCCKWKFEMSPTVFFSQLVRAIRYANETVSSSYNNRWKEIKVRIEAVQQRYIEDHREWCDFTALSKVIAGIPLKTNIQVSNGMSVRYLMSMSRSYKFHRVDSNRGVNGIDGSTSTALGASVVYKGMTLLVSGDVSAKYDIGALLDAQKLTHNFKMLILDNGGGNIFDIIKASNDEEVRRKYLICENNVNWKDLAVSAGWICFESSEFKTLDSIIPKWLATRQSPSLLILHTSSKVNTDFYRNYLALSIFN